MSGAQGAITLCVTSCGRLDLLARTLTSLFAANRDAFAESIVIEDAGDQAVAAYLAEHFPEVRVISNAQQLGQMRSIDKMYAEVTTPLIFHCEDDWLFDPVPFVEDCRKVLAAERAASAVCVRKPTDLPPKAAGFLQRRRVGEVGYCWMPPQAHPQWFGYTLNPGLARRELWERYGPFARHVTEAAISVAMKADGLSTAFLEPGACAHIGRRRHVADPFQPHRPTTVLGKLRRSVNKRLAEAAGQLRRLGSGR